MTHRRRDSAGFTLIEMLVVLGLIIMVTAIALPNIATIIRANADAQAHNLMSGLIKSARITAMRDGVYAGVHQQLASPDSPSNRRLAGSSFAAVLTTYALRSLVNIYVDNTQVQAPSGWVVDSALTGQYGGDYIHDNNMDKGLTVVFEPELTHSCKHDVYMRWPANSGNANNVPVTVFHVGGSTDYTINQQTNGGKWILLGRHECAPGIGRVEIRTDGTSGRVIADAVRFVPIIEVANFNLAAGQTPKRIPGTMVFGEVKAPEGPASPGTYVSGGYNAEGVGGSGQNVEPGSSNDIHVKDFTTFSLIFTPLGGLTCMPNKQDVFFTDDEYVPGQSALFGGGDPLWSLGVANADSDGDGEIGEPGARVITMFDYSLFTKRLGDERVTFLNETAQLMPINVLLGMLVERQ